MVRIFGRKLTPNFTKKLFSVTRGAQAANLAGLFQEAAQAIKSKKIEHFADYEVVDCNLRRHVVMEAVGL